MSECEYTRADPARDSNLTRQMASLMWTPNPRRLDAKGLQYNVIIIVIIVIVLLLLLLIFIRVD